MKETRINKLTDENKELSKKAKELAELQKTIAQNKEILTKKDD